MVPAGPFSTRCELRPSRPTRGVSGQDQNLFQFNGRLHWLKLTRQSGPPISHHLLPRRLSWIHGPSTTTSWFEHGEAGTAKMRQIVCVNSKSSVTIETGMPAVVHEGCVREVRRSRRAGYGLADLSAFPSRFPAARQSQVPLPGTIFTRGHLSVRQAPSRSLRPAAIDPSPNPPFGFPQTVEASRLVL